MGYRIGNKKAYVSIKPVDITAEDIRSGRYRFDENGIYLIGKDGTEHRGFMYKRSYRLTQYGKPRYHLCKCSTIESFLESGRFYQQYRWSNDSPVKVIDIDDNLIDKEVDDLPLCKNCLKMLMANGEDYESTTNRFVEMLKKHGELSKEVDVDIFGYTRDWEFISSEFRKKTNYTCEHCGVQVNEFDRRFIHVHHKDGNKLHNTEDNLACLCIECHSQVDRIHQQNFSNNSAQKMIKRFRDKYRSMVSTNSIRQNTKLHK